MAKLNGNTTHSNPSGGDSTLDLRNLRQCKGVSLEQIAERTKISIRFLRAIEAEEFKELPGGIFATSYLRQYAEAVGADAGRLLAHYEEKAEIRAEPRVTAPIAAGRSTLLRLFLPTTATGR